MKVIHDAVIRVMICTLPDEEHYSSYLDVLYTWVTYGYVLEGRHVCMFHHMFPTISTGTLDLMVRGAAIGDAKLRSLDHDKDCNLSESGKSIAYH